jgi:hypothetical protein
MQGNCWRRSNRQRRGKGKNERIKEGRRENEEGRRGNEKLNDKDSDSLT